MANGDGFQHFVKSVFVGFRLDEVAEKVRDVGGSKEVRGVPCDEWSRSQNACQNLRACLKSSLRGRPTIEIMGYSYKVG